MLLNTGWNAIAKVIVVVAAASLMGACSSEPPAPSKNGTSQPIPNVRRPNLVVADIERALTIYRDVLGLDTSTIRTSTKEDYSYPVFNIPQDATLRFISLHEPGETGVMNLTEVKGIDIPRPHSAPFMSTVVIGISDLEAKFEQLKAMGLTVTRSEVAGNENFKFIEQAFVDFDGHLIVCYEILK